MTTELTALVPSTIAETKDLASLLSKSNLLPPDLIGKEANVFMSIMAGRELGIPPMASIRGISIIKGRPTLTADLMCAVVVSRKLTKNGFKKIEATATRATYEVHRVDRDEPDRVTWTIEDAKTAGLLGKDNWKGYPRQMLAARAKAELARDVFPDVLAGCYTEDEADEIAANENTPTPTDLSGFSAPPRAAEREPDAVDAEIVEPTPPTPPTPIADATDLPKSTPAPDVKTTKTKAAELLENFDAPLEVVAEIDLMLHEISEATTLDAMTRVGNICSAARKADDARAKSITLMVWPQFQTKYRELKTAATKTARGSR